MKTGDKVTCYILGHGGKPEDVFIIGVPTYSDGFDHIVCVAAKVGQCMPVNVAHLTKISGGHDVSEMIAAVPSGFMKEAPHE